ncbi:MAG: hypothetical protein MZV64_58990 [Ignavibacteriales bacterium]|nr:hypothetical protein [Ignavibacteriales bacterium]
MVGIFLFQTGVWAYSNLKGNRQINGPFESFSTEMYDYVKANTPSESVIVFFKPRAFRLFTDRDAIMALECGQLLARRLRYPSQKLGVQPDTSQRHNKLQPAPEKSVREP